MNDSKQSSIKIIHIFKLSSGCQTLCVHFAKELTNQIIRRRNFILRLKFIVVKLFHDPRKNFIDNANGGARAYPMQPYMGLLHTALSTELADYVTGTEDAAKALADVEAAYSAAAKEGGFL